MLQHNSIAKWLGGLLFLGALGGCAELQDIGRQLDGITQVETAQGLMLVVEDVLFDTNKSTLRPQATETIAKAVEILEQMPERNILVAGHADARGSADYNRLLSRHRAEAVRDVLVQKGIAASRILTRDYGHTRPVASNDTEEGRQRNRRVEITILKPGALLD